MRVAVALVLLVMASPALAGPREEARRHYRQGDQFYDEGQFIKAAEEYYLAFSFKSDPALLFNTAMCYRLGLDHARAVSFFEAFLQRYPHAPNREEAEKLLAEERQAANEVQIEPPKKPPDPKASEAAIDAARLEALHRQAAEQEAAEEERRRRAPPPPPPEEDDGRPKPVYKRWYFWLGLGLGAAVVAGGVTTAVVLTARPWTNAPDFGPGVQGLSFRF